MLERGGAGARHDAQARRAVSERSGEKIPILLINFYLTHSASTGLFKGGKRMLLKMRVLATAVGIAVASSATPGLAATSIDTTGAFTSNWHPFGQPDTSAYGETFTVGSDNVLNSFSLYLDGQVASTLNFTAYVYAWNGSMITGSALYTSANQIFNGSADNSPVEFAFNTGSLSLNSG